MDVSDDTNFYMFTRDYLNLEFEEEGTHQGSEERRMPSRSVQNRPNIKFTHHQYLTPSPSKRRIFAMKLKSACFSK